MPDPWIRDVPAQPATPVSVADLTRFSAAAADLADPAVLSDAWS